MGLGLASEWEEGDDHTQGGLMRRGQGCTSMNITGQNECWLQLSGSSLRILEHLAESEAEVEIRAQGQQKKVQDQDRQTEQSDKEESRPKHPTDHF